MASNEGFIDILSPGALKELKEANSEVLVLIGNINKAKAVQMAKTPSQSNDAIKKLSQDYLQQEKIIQSLQKKIIALARSQEESVIKQKIANEKLTQSQTQTSIKTIQLKKQEIDLDAKLAREADKAQRTTEKPQEALERSNNTYSKVQVKVNELIKTYNDLAIKQELGISLSTREQAQLDAIVPRINKYQTALINVDKNIQKHGRSVG